MTILDPGHIYELKDIDGGDAQTLCFVKRIGPNYPGNEAAHPGTTSQSVIRALLDRTRYLQGQKWCVENTITILALSISLWVLEFRAARRHGLWYWHGLRFAATAPMCGRCAHTVCRHGDA